jgi:hypothetical protein
MVLPRRISVLGRRVGVLIAGAALVGALTSTVFAGAVTAGADDPTPPSRLPVDRGTVVAAPPRAPSAPAVVKSPAARPRKCGDAHASTPRS